MRKNLALVSKHEIVISNSHSRLEARDRETEILDLVSKHETERKKFSILSRELRKASRYALLSLCVPVNTFSSLFCTCNTTHFLIQSLVLESSAILEIYYYCPMPSEVLVIWIVMGHEQGHRQETFSAFPKLAEIFWAKLFYHFCILAQNIFLGS